MSPIALLKDTGISPLVSDTIRAPESGTIFTVAAFEGSDWSLKPLQRQGDARTNSDLSERIARAVHGLGGSKIYAPSPVKFNGKIIAPSALQHIIPLSFQDKMIPLCRNAETPADGTFLSEPGDAGIFSAGGCSMVVATFRKQLIFAHAGRDCVLDRVRIETQGKERGREYESVVDAMMHALGPSIMSEFEEVHAWVLFSIKPEDFLHRFDDPKYSEFNWKMAQDLGNLYGDMGGVHDGLGIRPNVPGIAKTQFMHWGVPEQNIHLEHSYLVDELPHTRKGDASGRYLASVVRHT